MPRKIRELKQDLKAAGWYPVPGSKHRKFQHANVRGSVILGGHEGDDAQRYQEKQVRAAIEAAQREKENHGQA
jgi:hypothetical protein